ncbi:MAG: NAD(+)--rifampin ADP-ribosyltransferase [Chitinophagaceae bacterium]|nr:MAG: NAD(+)--rifampin ADP-ribosyltransferase [Chitinophagaceae bacterium]
MERDFKEGQNLENAGNEKVTFFHGCKADLLPGDFIRPGFISNYGTGKKAKYVYFTATLDAAVWGTELAQGSGRERIYIVEPTGPFEDDPNLTNKKYPGNPTRSYRTAAPLLVIGELDSWQGHSKEQLDTMKTHLNRLKEQGIEAIED